MNEHLSDFEIQEMVESKNNFPEKQSHLKECAVCSSKYQSYKNLFLGLNELPEINLAENFAESVINRLEDTSIEKIKSYQKIVYFAINIFAALIFHILLKEINFNASSAGTLNSGNALQFSALVLFGVIVFVYIFINGYQKIFQRKNYLDDITL